MSRHQTVKWVDSPQLGGDLGPPLPLEIAVLYFVLGQVIRHGDLAGDAPDDRQRSVSADEISPMLLQATNTHPRQVITPRADNARRYARVHQMKNPPVGRVEIFGPNRAIVLRPRKTGLVGSAGIESRHIRVKAGDDLDDVEPLAEPVLCQSFEFIRKMEPLSQN